MPEAYDSAALRHAADAVLLERERRPDNADQLAGFAAECAIKFALAQLPVFSDGHKLVDRYRAHVDVLWDRVPLQGLQKRFPSLMALLKVPNPFTAWSVDQRYASDGAVGGDDHARHLLFARRLLASVQLAGVRREG